MCTGAREEVRRLMSVLLQRESKYSHEIRNTDFYLTSATRERERERERLLMNLSLNSEMSETVRIFTPKALSSV